MHNGVLEGYSPIGRIYSFAILFTLLALAAVVGKRDIMVGMDTFSYVASYQAMQECQCLMGWHEPGFELLSLPVAFLGADPSVFLIWLSGIGMLLMWYVSTLAGSYAPSGRARGKLTALVVCLFLFSPLFLSAQINAIRQGMAALALLAMAIHISNDSKKRAVVWAAVAVSLHFSSIMYLASLLFILGPPIVLYMAALASFILYVTGFTEPIVAWFSSFTGVPLYQMVSEYGINAEYQSGVRLDFAIASAAFLAIALVIKATSKKVIRDQVDWFIKVYLCFILPFLWLGWGAFSDRYAYTAWFVMSMIGGLGLYSYLRRLPRMVFLAAVMLAGVFFWSGLQ